jgi:hypothetical protein
LKVTVPVGLNPPVTVATSWIWSPTWAPAVAWVLIDGLAGLTTTLSLASVHLPATPTLLPSPE